MTKRYAALVAAALFFLLTLACVLIPGFGASLRFALRSLFARDADYVDVFREIGEKFSARDPAPERTSEAALHADLPLEKETVGYRIEEAVPAGEFLPAPTEAPAAVAAFLRSQEAFSDYALPENVDYAYSELPFPYSLPVGGYQSSGFGYRLHPILHIVRFHYGTDVAANAGDSVLAFADGTVVFAGYDESYGYHLKIDHGGGWVSHYCHCSKLTVRQDAQVARGETVALVGATGLATGPHLHFELTHDGVYVNPEYYINA